MASLMAESEVRAVARKKTVRTGSKRERERPV